MPISKAGWRRGAISKERSEKTFEKGYSDNPKPEADQVSLQHPSLAEYLHKKYRPVTICGLALICPEYLGHMRDGLQVAASLSCSSPS